MKTKVIQVFIIYLQIRIFCTFWIIIQQIEQVQPIDQPYLKILQKRILIAVILKTSLTFSRSINNQVNNFAIRSPQPNPQQDQPEGVNQQPF
ncbi:unnamed protein product (macronuclear) [Paramecium tetraurelia]|uniref:Transmembrane protein n=1 Tax=Paramecium tetraurelia TaxID=5888 RepID=A0DJ17_PARTE|nr:uncharacterized protein GSPATT00017391001 [Paramecium tetraurelia]CAK83034.1 unnamed protein product [Paramecium tetraurelia]|eukprot:XP_001450431.1 hypothetical protein (macronuclear) [Paramecium tetraurelia strain d4-2]